MKAFLLALGALWALHVHSRAGQLHDLHTESLFNVNGSASQGAWAYQTGVLQWPNNTGHVLYIKRVWVFCGVSGDGNCDFAAGMSTSSGDTILVNNWDHYANPTSMEGTLLKWESNGTDYFILPMGGIIYFSANGMSYSGVNNPIYLQTTARVWATYDSP